MGAGESSPESPVQGPGDGWWGIRGASQAATSPQALDLDEGRQVWCHRPHVGLLTPVGRIAPPGGHAPELG